MKNLDVFRFRASFNIDSKESFQTKIGGILTISLVLIYSALLYFYGKEMLEKKSPYGYQEVKYHNTSSPDFYWDLKENKFFVGFQVVNYNSSPLDTNEYLFPLFRLLKYEIQQTEDPNTPYNKSAFQKMYFTSLLVVGLLSGIAITLIVKNNFGENFSLTKIQGNDRIAVLEFTNNTYDEKLNIIFEEIDTKPEVGEFTQDEVQKLTIM